MITYTVSGSWDHTERFLKNAAKLDISGILQSCAKDGVTALASATPIDSNLAASSWTYAIEKSGSGYRITWLNTDVENGFPVAIMLQYGYGTGTGGYVQGKDYINPAMKPIFDNIAERVWKAVTSV